MSSTFAEIVLALSIPLMVGVFFVMRLVPATLVVVLGAEMFLPVGPSFKLPYMPSFGKMTLPYVCILIACLLRHAGRVTKLPKEKWILLLAILLIASGVATSLTNREPLILGNAGQVFLPGLTVKDGFYMGISNFTGTFLPFYLGYAIFRNSEDFEKLLSGLAIAGLVYIPFALVELRLSPQWHYWIYGYYQHAFDQTIRFGGYRPMIFMSHGLAVAQFFLAAMLSLIVLAKSRRRIVGLPTRFLAWAQFVVLVACKSTGSIIYATASGPLVALAKPKRQLLVAVIIAWITLLYPLLRLSGVFPVASLLDAAGALQEERAESLGVRFYNEDAMLARVRECIFFGWGEYGRNIVRNQDGSDNSTLDGYWIIRLSMYGLAGFICGFGPLLIPVFLTRRHLSRFSNDRDKLVVAGVALTLVFLTVDLIPNAMWASYPFMIAGALTRRLREAKANPRERESAGEQRDRGTTAARRET